MASLNDAPLVTAPILVVDEAPTINTTGTLTYWGMAFIA